MKYVLKSYQFTSYHDHTDTQVCPFLSWNNRKLCIINLSSLCKWLIASLVIYVHWRLILLTEVILHYHRWNYSVGTGRISFHWISLIIDYLNLHKIYSHTELGYLRCVRIPGKDKGITEVGEQIVRNVNTRMYWSSCIIYILKN